MLTLTAGKKPNQSSQQDGEGQQSGHLIEHVTFRNSDQFKGPSAQMTFDQTISTINKDEMLKGEDSAVQAANVMFNR